MQICVTATRNYPHPIQDKVTLASSVSITETTELEDFSDETVAHLQLRAEELVENHMGEVIENINTQAKNAEMVKELRELSTRSENGQLTTAETQRFKQLQEALADLLDVDPEKPIPFELGEGATAAEPDKPLLENTVTQATDTTTAAAAETPASEPATPTPTTDAPSPTGEPEQPAAS